jgi:cbb3-type cytochrome oxidase maturation protein
MGVIFVVLPLALIVVLVAVLAFVWAARSGQFDDTTTPAIRPLIEGAEEEGGRREAGDPEAE